MKEIKAIIHPQRLAAVRAVLHSMPDFPGMTITKVEGCKLFARGRQTSKLKDQLTDYVPKLRVEVVADDAVAQRIADSMIEVLRAGTMNSGMVWISEVERAVFVSTFPNPEGGPAGNRAG